MSGVIVGRACLVTLSTGLSTSVSIATSRLLRLITVGAAAGKADAENRTLDELVRLSLGSNVSSTRQDGDRDDSLEVHLGKE